MDAIKMGDSSVVHILLPICIESETDVFLKILRKALAHSSRLDDHYLINAFKSGMNGNKIFIDLNDLKINWKELKTEKDQIRHAKMLGYWSIKNFPSLGKKFFVGKYCAPQRKVVGVIGGSEEMAEDVIDEFISSKMQLRVLHLNVGHTTLPKLKHFVKVPAQIQVYNECQISPKIKTFEIKNDHVANCWAALKFGEFLLNLNFKDQIDSLSTTSVQADQAQQQIDTENDESVSGTDEHQANSQKYEFHGGIDKINSENGSKFDPPPSKRICLDTADSNDSGIGSLRMVLLKIEKDIGDALTLTKSFDHTGHISKGTDCEERLQIMILKQKDAEIARMKASEELLLQLNQTLTNEKSNFKEQLEKLQETLNQWRDYVSKKDEEVDITNKNNENLQKELVEQNEQNKQMKKQIQELNDNLAEAEKRNVNLDDTNTKQQETLYQWRDYASKKDEEVDITNKNNENLQKELVEQNKQMKKQIQELNDNLAEAEKRNVNLDDTNTKQQETLYQWRDYASKKDEEVDITNKNNENLQKELVEQNEQNKKMKKQIQELSDSLAEAENRNVNLDDTNTKLQETLNQWRDYASKNDEKLYTANKSLSTKEKVEQDLDVLKKNANSMVTDLQSRIEKLERKLTEALKANSEIIDQREKLHQELNILKKNAASNKSDVETQTATYVEMKQESAEDENETSNDFQMRCNDQSELTLNRNNQESSSIPISSKSKTTMEAKSTIGRPVRNTKQVSHNEQPKRLKRQAVKESSSDDKKKKKVNGDSNDSVPPKKAAKKKAATENGKSSEKVEAVENEPMPGNSRKIKNDADPVTDPEAGAKTKKPQGRSKKGEKADPALKERKVQKETKSRKKANDAVKGTIGDEGQSSAKAIDPKATASKAPKGKKLTKQLTPVTEDDAEAKSDNEGGIMAKAESKPVFSKAPKGNKATKEPTAATADIDNTEVAAPKPCKVKKAQKEPSTSNVTAEETEVAKEDKKKPDLQPKKGKEPAAVAKVTKPNNE